MEPFRGLVAQRGVGQEHAGKVEEDQGLARAHGALHEEVGAERP